MLLCLQYKRRILWAESELTSKRLSVESKVAAKAVAEVVKDGEMVKVGDVAIQEVHGVVADLEEDTVR